jgi:hypothetical protein
LGAGEEAGRIAGRIRHLGRFVMLLPREFDIAAAGREAPLPVPRPKAAELYVAKADGKDTLEIGETDGKAKSGLAGTDSFAAAKRSWSPQHTPAIAADIKKQDARGAAPLDNPKQDEKGKANSARSAAGAIGLQKPPLAPNTKIAVLENDRQASRRKAGASATGNSIVLPVLKPQSSINAGKKEERTDGGKTVGAGSTAIAAGLHKPASLTGPKASDFEAKKKEIKRKAVSANIGETAAGGQQKPLPPESRGNNRN